MMVTRNFTATTLLVCLLGCTDNSKESVEPTDSDVQVPQEPAEFLALIDGARYQSDLERIAVPRTPGSANWQMVQDLCASELAASGFEVELHAYGTGVNVVGRLSGTTRPQEQVILSAHYDSVGDCPGADDNATGVAGALESARVLAKGEFDRTLVVACWDEEERGLIGSEAYAARAVSQGDQILVAVSYEMIGFRSSQPDSQTLPPGFGFLFPDQAAEITENDARADWIALIGDAGAIPFMQDIETYAAAQGVPAITVDLQEEQTSNPQFADFRRSDHDAFWQQGYPAIMVTDTANFRNQAYHCEGAEDTVDRLDQDFSVGVIQGVVGAAVRALRVD